MSIELVQSLTPLQMVQQTELEMADLVDDICRRHSLRYSLAFGSLIGAVRHKGFIPWDDDIDILMPRDDYERFLRIARDELPNYYEVQHFRFGTSERYVSRIADKRTLMHLSSYGEGNDLRIWFDIFVLDGLPDGYISRQLRYLEVLWRKACASFAAFDRTVNLHRPGRPKWQQLIINLCAVTHFGKLWNLERCLEKYDRTLTRDGTFDHESCFCGAGTYGARKQTWPSSAFQNLVNYEFEGRLYLGPCDYNAVLAATYGDYMTLPPENQRTIHEIDLIEHPMIAQGKAR